MAKPQSIDLMETLLARGPQATEAARAAFRTAHPDAPQEMIDAAVFHVITDGIEATIDWLAAIEQFLRDPAKSLNYGALWHLLYHLYNYHQLEALIPVGIHGTKTRLEDIRLLLEENDTAAALSQLKELAAALGGDVQPPRTV
jgi:hypothetical protein